VQACGFKANLMITYPNIDPVAFHIGPLSVRWYGIMYLLGFATSYLLVRYQIAHPVRNEKGKGDPLPEGFLDDLYVSIILGLLIGARLGYVLFYGKDLVRNNPLEVLAIWHGGMSFHGGLIGGIVTGLWLCRLRGVDPWRMTDLVVVTVPIGLGLGRLGNFINGELYGRVTDLPWAMIFADGGPLPRHPSQLYELMLEGVFLFLILWLVRPVVKRDGLLTSIFLLCYGSFRIIAEFFREPDRQLGFIVGPITMGQLLSAAMLPAGIIVAVFAIRWRSNL
jgi:phosphatidylglycerol:prolipoprotein diacylglycerol transferase